MPGVLNRYINYENAGDQYVSKSGHRQSSKKFVASCAYWDFLEEAPNAKATAKDRLHNYL